MERGEASTVRMSVWNIKQNLSNSHHFGNGMVWYGNEFNTNWLIDLSLSKAVPELTL